MHRSRTIVAILLEGDTFTRQLRSKYRVSIFKRPSCSGGTSEVLSKHDNHLRNMSMHDLSTFSSDLRLLAPPHNHFCEVSSKRS